MSRMMHNLTFFIFQTILILCVTGQECTNEPHDKTWKGCKGDNKLKNCSCTACPNKKEILVCQESSETGYSWKSQTTTCVDCLKSRCWPTYKPSPKMICTSPLSETELQIGAKFNCTCDNCAPVLITCESNGSDKQWTYNGICDNDTYTNVSIPDIDPHALLSKNGGEYIFSCVTGYNVTSSKYTKCERGKVNSVPKCERVKCSGNSPNGMDCTGFDTDKVAMYEDKRHCNCKHTCIPINITCGSNGQWNYNRVPCKIDDSFPATALIEFGEHILTSFSNTSLQFQCKNGYKLIGNATVDCINGKPVSDIPKCELDISTSNIITISICFLVVGCLVIIIIIFIYRKYTDNINISVTNCGRFPTINQAFENDRHEAPLPTLHSPSERRSSVEYDEIVLPRQTQQSDTNKEPTSPILNSGYAVPIVANTSSDIYAAVMKKDQETTENDTIPVYSEVVVINGKKQTLQRNRDRES